MTPADLRARRLGLGLSQKSLAEMLGVWEHTIYRWEASQRAIPPFLAAALSWYETLVIRKHQKRRRR